MADESAKNQISRIDTPIASLVAATATGAGFVKSYPGPVNHISMQVVFTGGSPTVKVRLEGTIDGVSWATLATFDTAAAGVSGGIVSSSTHAVMAARAYLETLSGGSDPTVTANILANRGSP